MVYAVKFARTSKPTHGDVGGGSVTRAETLDLEKLFRPNSIAIIGASRDSTSIGGKPLHNLISHAYEGSIYPVNPKYTAVAGYDCYPSLSEVPGNVDVALVAVSQARTIQILEECVSKGVKFAFLFGAGFAEAGEEGEEVQEKIVELARQSQLRVLGPNCIGCLNAKDSIPMGFATSFETDSFLPGPVGMASQSGAFGSSLFALAQEEGVGFSYMANTGNEADLNTLDFLSFMVDDESTTVVSAYLEAIPEGDRLVQIANRAIDRKKPIVALKAGSSELGGKAALSHTASLTGSADAFRAVSKQCGITLVNDIEDMLDAMKVFSRRKWVAGNRVAVVTTSGALGILMADYCDEFGLEMPPLSDATIDRLASIIPSYGSTMNPVDITAHALNDREIFREVMHIIAKDDQVDAVVVTTTFGGDLLRSMCQDLVALDQATEKPLLVTLTGSQEIVSPGEEVLKKASIPTYVVPYRSANALSYLVQFSQFLEDHRRGSQLADLNENYVYVEESSGIWTEDRVKELLSRLGIPVPRGEAIVDIEDGKKMPKNLSYPVVAKILSQDIVHKTEAGAVEVGIRTPDELAAACERILASSRTYAPHATIDGLLVEEMVCGEGKEMFIGVTDDPQFGPLVVCGMGGIFAEVLQDTAIRRAPISPDQAHSMISELKGFPLLTGARGTTELDTEALAHSLVSISIFAYGHRGRIKEMDVNPLRVKPKGQGVVALDGMIIWSE